MSNHVGLRMVLEQLDGSGINVFDWNMVEATMQENHLVGVDDCEVMMQDAEDEDE